MAIAGVFHQQATGCPLPKRLLQGRAARLQSIQEGDELGPLQQMKLSQGRNQPATVKQLRSLDAEDVCLRKWSLPVVLATGSKPARFGAIRECLGPITDRALTLALRDLDEAGLLTRRVIDSYPPTPQYQLAAKTRPLLPILRELARRAIL